MVFFYDFSSFLRQLLGVPGGVYKCEKHVFSFPGKGGLQLVKSGGGICFFRRKDG